MHHFFYLLLCLSFGLLPANQVVFAMENQDTGIHSLQNIQKDMTEFVEKPHPFGTSQNAKLAQKILKSQLCFYNMKEPKAQFSKGENHNTIFRR